MHEAYAQALWDMIEAGKEPHEAVAALRKNLDMHSRSALLPRIARAFERLAARDSKKNNMTVSVARHKDAAHALKEAQRAMHDAGLQDVQVEQKIDENLIGGWRLEGRGLLVDKSWKHSLLSIFGSATK